MKEKKCVSFGAKSVIFENCSSFHRFFLLVITTIQHIFNASIDTMLG